MGKAIPAHHPLGRFFRGLVEQTFYVDLGMCDPQLAGYLSGLLTQFVHIDQIFALRNATGRRIEDVAEMVSEAYLGPGVSEAVRRRIVHRHIGDFTLFWTGVYPEGLRRLRAPQRKDHLVDYLQQGKRSYAIASDLTPAEQEPSAQLLRRLSEKFEFCVYGLGLVRKGWERSRPDSFRAARALWQ
ncbi:MAG: hypothetical protein ACE5K7_01280 [Phycisphaerae bacterium]